MPFELKRFLFKRRNTLRQWMKENNLSTQEEVNKELERDSLLASKEDLEEIKHLLKPVVLIENSILIPVVTEEIDIVVEVLKKEEKPFINKKKEEKPIEDIKEES